MSTRSVGSRLLQLAVPLVKNYGFTRQALAQSVLALPSDEASHTEPLSDTAVSALFGHGDVATRNLVNAWLDHGIKHMHAVPVGATVKDALRARLEYNQPVLCHLPEAFAILATPEGSPLPVDPTAAVRHIAGVADEACRATNQLTPEFTWYTQRMQLSVIYGLAELHQLTSPTTVYPFLDLLFENSESVESLLNDANQYSSYIIQSWKGIIKSSGIF